MSPVCYPPRAGTALLLQNRPRVVFAAHYWRLLICSLTYTEGLGHEV